MSPLEASIRRLTQPVNGQFPRPWMTTMAHPEKARIFVVGYNQATCFPAARIGSHDDFIDALFNRNERSCRKLYEQLRGEDGPSPTRKNIDRLPENLAREGLDDVVETNVICYSTPMSSDLTSEKAAGRQIFREILAIIRPEVLIAHGAGTAKELGRVLSKQLPAEASSPADGVSWPVFTHNCGRVPTRRLFLLFRRLLRRAGTAGRNRRSHTWPTRAHRCGNFLMTGNGKRSQRYSRI